MSDDGAADPRLDRALAAHDGSPPTRAEVLAALADARVFVAVTATATAEETTESGLRRESSAEMALVTLVASDGERAVPAFADTAAVTRFRLGVRPVRLSAPDLARAALDDDAAAVLLDPAGARVVLRRPDLVSLAAGYVPVPGAPLAARRTTATLSAPTAPADPQLLAALAAALAPEGLAAARLLAGPGGPVLGVAPSRPLGPDALAALAQRVMTRLGPALPASGLDVAVVPPVGPGQVIVG